MDLIKQNYAINVRGSNSFKFCPKVTKFWVKNLPKISRTPQKGEFKRIKCDHVVYLSHIIFFNVNEHLAVSSVILVRGGSHVGHLCLFCLHWFTPLSIPSHKGLIFPVSYILLSTCLYGWSNSNISLIHLTMRTVSEDHI